MPISDWSSDVCSSDLQHLLEQPGVDPARPRGVARDGSADVLRAKDLAEYLVPLPHRRRLRSQHRIEQPAAAKPGDQSAESLDPAALRLFLKAAKDRGKQRFGALLRDAGRNAQFLRHRFDAAGLLQYVGEVHGFSPSGARIEMRRQALV